MQAIELELDTYSGLINEMGNIATAMIKVKHPDSQLISARQDLIAQELGNLRKLTNLRRKRLMESMHRHEYFAEANDLESWMNEQMGIATSDDYGKDYEHLLVSCDHY